MNSRRFTPLGIAALMLLAVGAQASDYYVAVAAGNDANTGLSASAAFKTIQKAISTAAANDTVHVAAGTYPESLDWENKDLVIEGAGAGQSVIDPSTANGGPGGGCVYTSGLSAASHIDGFTFQNGSANYGGGMDNQNSSLTISDCVFQNDSAYYGGGMYNYTSSPTLTNCLFQSNSAYFRGGGMYNDVGSSPTLTNCTFSGNSANGYGGGMDNHTSSPTLTNCTFSGNSAGGYGGGMFNDSSPTLTNCLLWGNSAQFGGNGIFNYQSNPTVTYSDLQDLTNATPDSNHNFGADPLFVRAPFTNGSTDYGDLHLQWGSPAIDAGDDSVLTSPPFPANPSGTLLDQNCNPRLSRTHVDLGAYEYQDQPPVVNAGPNQTLTATHSGNPATDTATLTLNGSATDPENDALAYIWTDATYWPVGYTASISLTLPPGAYTFILTVLDPFGFGRSSVQVIVNPAPNAAPVLHVPAAVSGVVGTPLTFKAAATDADGDPLTYTLLSAPAGATLNAATGAFAWTPSAAGTYSAQVKVTDAYGASVTKKVALNVSALAISNISLTRSSDGTLTCTFSITNPSQTQTATNVTLTQATLGRESTSTPLPHAYASLLPGASKPGSLQFKGVVSGPATLVIKGSCSLGAFFHTQTVKVP